MTRPATLAAGTVPRHAGDAVEFVRAKFGFALPYSPESLLVVDAIVDKIKETGATEQQAAGVLVNLGCYVGEVFVRHVRASWRATPEMAGRAASRFPVVLALPDLTAHDAIGCVFERFTSGAPRGAERLYERIVGSGPVPESTPASRPSAGPDPDPSTPRTWR